MTWDAEQFDTHFRSRLERAVGSISRLFSMSGSASATPPFVRALIDKISSPKKQEPPQ